MGQDSSIHARGQMDSNGNTYFNSIASHTMGSNLSRNSTASANYINYHTFEAEIPISLRLVHTFLYDAQRYLRATKKFHSNDINTIHRKSLALSCINHAMQLLILLNIDIKDDEIRQCLYLHNLLRTQLSLELGVLITNIDPNFKTENKFASHDILLAEADAVLSLADEQIQRGFNFEGMLNYHTASIFFRVLMSMMPSLAPIVKQRLAYTASKTRFYSPLSHNFVKEHFDDVICGDLYEVHGSVKLGTGSYGSVYLATHKITGEERAVKVMNVDKVTSYYLRKLHTEIAILRSVDHPNIIKLQEVFFGRRSVYLVTDLCRGGELFELLNNGKSQGFVFREDRASCLMRDMISAVNYLHSLGIVHRDLKLENFLFEAKTVTSPLVLIDFGLSRFFDKDEKLNHRVGSCYYTAPEVLSGTYSSQCDCWSLGVLCYMLLSGTPPFYGKTVDEVYNATLTQPLVFADKKFRHVSAVCIDFMKRFLVKDPEKRMTTTEALKHPFLTGYSDIHETHVVVKPPINTIWTVKSGTVVPVSSTSETTLSPTDIDRDPVLTTEVADSILNCVSVFGDVGLVIQLILTAISYSLSLEQTEDFRKIFQAVDTNHSGLVSMNELHTCLSVCEEVSSGGINLHALVNSTKLDSTSQASYIGSSEGMALGFHEFVAIMLVQNRKDIADDQIRSAFNSLCQGKSKHCTLTSLRDMLGGCLSDQRLNEFLISADVDNDGAVGESDFMSCWRSFQKFGRIRSFHSPSLTANSADEMDLQN